MALQRALPGDFYTSSEHWLLERDGVLAREWVSLGRLDDLGLDRPGRRAVAEVLGESLLLTSDRTGTLHAFFNVCRHRGSQLVPVEPGTAQQPAPCDAASLRCPYHSWTYDLDGSLLRAPHAEDDALDRQQFTLHPAGVAVWQGFVLVHLGDGGTPERPGPPAPALLPLPDDLARIGTALAGYGLAGLVTGARLDYDVRANYKVVLENYNECYHCGPVHPELCRLVPSFAGGGGGLDWEGGVPHREGTWTFTTSGTTTRRPLPGLGAEQVARHRGELAYPNLLLSCSGDHVAAFVVTPVAVDRTRVACSLLFDADEAARDDFDPSDAAELWDLVNRQDWAVCESVQRGMTSRAFRQGWFAPMEDDSVDIRRWLLPRLERAGADLAGAGS